MKKIVLQTLDNKVLDREIEDVNQIKNFAALLEENNLQVKDDIIFFIDYTEQKISKINLRFIDDSRFISVYKALTKKNYLADYLSDYLNDFIGDLNSALQLQENQQVIPQQFLGFNQRISGNYKYGSTFKGIKNQQFLEDRNISKLYAVDPLPKKPYFIWLVEQYKAEKLLPEDFFKAEELLSKFSNKRLRAELKKNGYPVKIENYDSINSLFKAIDSLPKDIDYSIDKKHALVLARKVAENNDWIISVPKTHEESILISTYGGTTNWCTAADSDNSLKMFKYYTANNKSLFICINKAAPDEKYQLNVEDGRFSAMDRYDEPIKWYDPSLVDLLTNTPVIFNELYGEESINAGLFKRQKPEIKNGVCEIYYEAENLEELTQIFSECLMFKNSVLLKDIDITELPEGLTIDGDLNIINTLLTELPDNLTVGGNLSCFDTKIIKTGNNLTVGGTLDFDEISELGNNLTVGGDLELGNKSLTTLPENLTVGGSLYLENTPITELPEGLSVGDTLNLCLCKELHRLPKDLTVGGLLNLSYTKITELPEGLSVGDTLNIDSTEIDKIPDNSNIGYVDLEKTKITKIGKNVNINRELICNDYITEIGDNLTVSGFLRIKSYYPIKIGDNLTVGRDLELEKSIITDLPKGVNVGGNLSINLNMNELPDDLRVDGEIITHN